MKKEQLGPSGDLPDTARHRALSAISRVRMLDLIRRSDAGLTAAEVVEAMGLHPSTVRAHLDQLAESGLVTRRRHGDGSPGRPAWRYRAASPAAVAEDRTDAGLDRPYRELAAALVGHIARDADDPHAAGLRAGRDWGRGLATALAGPRGRTRPNDGLIRVLDRLGFTPLVVERPDPDTAVLHLRSCPFLDLALANPDIVCGIHEGVVGGALGSLGARDVATDLEPFAAPGACVLRVRARSTASPGNAPHTGKARDRTGSGR